MHYRHPTIFSPFSMNWRTFHNKRASFVFYKQSWKFAIWSSFEWKADKRAAEFGSGFSLHSLPVFDALCAANSNMRWWQLQLRCHRVHPHVNFLRAHFFIRLYRIEFKQIANNIIQVYIIVTLISGVARVRGRCWFIAPHTGWRPALTVKSTAPLAHGDYGCWREITRWTSTAKSQMLEAFFHNFFHRHFVCGNLYRGLKCRWQIVVRGGGMRVDR